MAPNVATGYTLLVVDEDNHASKMVTTITTGQSESRFPRNLSDEKVSIVKMKFSLALIDNSKVKANIQDIEGIPPHHQLLIIAGKNLESPRTLKEYDMPVVFTFHLSLMFEDDMRIFIKTLIRKTITLVVGTSETICNVKEKIQAVEGFPWNQHRLFTVGKKLKNDKTLRDHNIEKESRLDLILGWGWGGDVFQIFVKTLTGKVIGLMVKILETIYNLKAKIWVIEQIPLREL
ncbi:unnamed protein product [Lactuca virosa]|uniref:Ubiquitin-like domain-containing protein n=1 Tax=Lactuca virosa TaxID=75947 RepID=A0AAU9ML24_9ASTR|nr:unnamed protein product [Lactuca virosa]